MWVFGYGSLMWKPGFPHDEARLAHIHGYHRALCVWSWVHRGTRARPGLVLGLDAGGSCVGIAHRVVAADRDSVVEYLYARELVTHVYMPVVRPIRIEDVGTAAALTFVADRGHDQYAGKLSAVEAARTQGDRAGAGPGMTRGGGAGAQARATARRDTAWKRHPRSSDASTQPMRMDCMSAGAPPPRTTPR
jgi:cation transport protein ChaC